MLLTLVIVSMVALLIGNRFSQRSLQKNRVPNSRRRLQTGVLAASLGALSVIGAPSASAFAAGAASAAEVAAGTPHSSAQPLSETNDYAARESRAKNLEKFEGGDTTVIIGGSALVIIIVVLLILILI